MDDFKKVEFKFRIRKYQDGSGTFYWTVERWSQQCSWFQRNQKFRWVGLGLHTVPEGEEFKFQTEEFAISFANRRAREMREDLKPSLIGETEGYF